MANDAQCKQSTREGLIYPVDFTNALLTGVTVTDATITHTPPSGAAATISKQVTTPIVYVKVPKGLAVGRHVVSVVATTSDADLSPEVRLLITVDN